jgi:hypothetical protein
MSTNTFSLFTSLPTFPVIFTTTLIVSFAYLFRLFEEYRRRQETQKNLQRLILFCRRQQRFQSVGKEAILEEILHGYDFYYDEEEEEELFPIDDDMELQDWDRLLDSHFYIN